MELNREQIVKALKNAIRLGKFYSYMTPKLSYEELRDALALIQELTEENEEKDQTIAGLIGTIKDAYGFAVREMKSRLYKNLLAVKDHTGELVLVVLDSDINQIAKELLEESK